MKKILSLFAALLFAFAVNAQEIPSTDFIGGYFFGAKAAVLDGNIELNEETETPYLRYFDRQVNGTATWQIQATKACKVAVTLNMFDNSWNNAVNAAYKNGGHIFTVKVLNGETEVGSVAEAAESSTIGDIALAGEIKLPAAGTYTVQLLNSREWSKCGIKGITLAAEAVPETDFAAPGYEFKAENAKISGNIWYNSENKTLYYNDKSFCGTAAWPIHATRGCYVSVTLNNNEATPNGHKYKVSVLDDNDKVIAAIEEPSQTSAKVPVTLDGTILIPEAGDYTIKLDNLTGWSSAVIDGIVLTYAADAPKEAPDAAPAAPEWPANQVKAVYSATYGADCGFGEWGSSTAYTQESFGKKYVTTNLGYFGMTFEDNALNCSEMEALHLDIWAASDLSLRVVPIHGGTEVGMAVSVYGQQWNSIDIPLEYFEGVTNWSNVYQIKIDNAPNLTFWVNNVFFYTTVAPAVDETAPADVTASATASYFSTTITAKATDASGAVIFTVKNGDEILAVKSAASDADAVIPVKGLKPNTEYNLSVIAADESGNAAEPVAVATKTLVAPAAAPAPEFMADDVKSIFSDAYTAAPASIGTMIAGWWEPTELSEGELADGDHALFYAPKATGMFGWEFAEFDATGFPYLHIDIYPLADGSIMIYPVDNIDPKQEYKETFDVKGNEWNHIVMDLTGKDLTKIYQIGWINYYALNGFFVDNVYFAKDEEPVVIEPADRRIIAWDLKSVLNGNDYKFTYKSNIDGYEANLIFLENGVEVGTKALDAPKAGVNEAIVPKDELPAGKLNWAIELKAGAVEAVKEFTDPSKGIYNFYGPRGIAVNNCTESDFFGNMYITGRDGASDGMTDRSKEQKGGIFQYDLALNELNPTNQGWLPGGIVAGTDPDNIKRIAVDPKDGMIYFNRKESILKIDPADMTAATNILEGKEDITLVNACFAENGVVYFMDNANVSTGGTLKKMDEAGNITSIVQSKLWGVGNVGITTDGRGGLWISQHRWSPDAYSVLTHVTAAGTLDYVVDKNADASILALFPYGNNASYRGQVAYNPKEDLIAFTGNRVVTLFKATYDAETGIPTLVRWKQTPDLAGNIDGVSFDLAGNLYVVSASSERMYAFGVPAEVNEVLVPAKSSLTVSSTATAIDETIAPVKAQKIFRNGEVLIIRDGKTYNMMGQIVK